MPRKIFYSLIILLIAFSCALCTKKKGETTMNTGKESADYPDTSQISGSNPQVLLKTSLGSIVIELFPDRAPATVANFLGYVNSAFYAGTIFHRVIPNFVIQGGGFLPGLKQKQTQNPIKNEAANGLSNTRGTIAMARTMVVDSATSQFYINLRDNRALDHRDTTPQGFGYCVFGRVIEGMDVVDRISMVQTGNVGPFSDVPVNDVTLLSAEKIK